MAFNKKTLIEDIDQSLAQQSKMPEPNYSPIWVNNQTRLNASNFNDRMYKTISAYTQTLANNAYDTAADGIIKVIDYNAGWRPTDIETDITYSSELHNYVEDEQGNINNAVNGPYQAAFGNGNILTEEAGQFVTGTYADTDIPELLFAIGNGYDTDNKSNAFAIDRQGQVTVNKIVADNISAHNGVFDEKLEVESLISEKGDIQNLKNETLTSSSGDITNIDSDTITVKTSVTSSIVNVTTAPTSNNNATNKQYVDNIVKNERERATSVEDTIAKALDAEIERATTEENSIRAIASSAFHFKGTKPTYNDLPKTGNTEGDVWQVGDKEYVWDGTKWIELGFSVDLGPYITTVDAEAKIAQAKQESIAYTDEQLDTKQDTLVSGTNIKTINGATLLGSGDIVISGSGTVDDALSTTSEYPVQNKVITQKINSLDFGDVDKSTTQNKVNMSLPGEGNLTFTLRDNEAYVTISETTQEDVPIVIRNQRATAEYEDEATSKAYVDAQGAAVALGEFVTTQSWTVPDAIAPLPFGIRRNINILNPDPIVTQSGGKITYDSDTDAFTISGEITTSASVGGVVRLHAISFSNVFDNYQERSKNIPYTFYIDHRSGSYSIGKATITLYDNTGVILASTVLDNTEEGAIQTVRLTRVPTVMVLQITSSPYTFNDYSLRFGLLTSDSTEYVKHDDTIVYGSTQLITVLRQSPGSTISNRLFNATVLADGEPSILNISQQQAVNAQKGALINISTKTYLPYNLKYLQDISTSLTEPYKIGTKIATKDYVDSQVHIVESGTVVVPQDEDPLGPEKDLPSGRHTPDVTWHYKKYSDNTVDMWASYRQNNVVLTTTEGALYAEDYSRYPKLPFKIKRNVDNTDIANVQLNVRGINWLMWGNGSLSLDTTANYIEHAQYQLIGTTAMTQPQDNIYVLVNIAIQGELYTE